ncbi:MAG: hypothetical protein DHS20C05_02230 [Hyphococcus sp.]|nr:MAG: hypothetical protein DHS20C05_02230 [Marinicaulis sp.]
MGIAQKKFFHASARFFTIFVALVFASNSHTFAQTHENGIGPDPDRDSNPATNTRIIPFIADATQASDDPPYHVITFEPPPGRHGEAIIKDYETDYGVKFGNGLSWQICEGQRRYQYDSMCTYEAPTSGTFSAGYMNYLNSPLMIEFERPVCVVTMSIYPTGGKEGEPFEFTIQGWTQSGEKLSTAKADFKWTNNTVRWRNMAGAYFVDQRAMKITVSMASKDPKEAKETLRYLIDDLAFVDEGCEAALDDIQERTGVDLRETAKATPSQSTNSTKTDAYEDFVDALDVDGS